MHSLRGLVYQSYIDGIKPLFSLFQFKTDLVILTDLIDKAGNMHEVLLI